MKLRGDMVVAGSCLAVIAAACQNGGEGEGEIFWTRGLMWGEIPSRREDGVERFVFSGGEVQRPRDGVAYM
jgi:hypothetical protein